MSVLNFYDFFNFFFTEFEPESYSKWKYLSEILTFEIPEERKKYYKNSQSSKILILCNDSRTCKQLNQYLTMGSQAFMYLSALRNELDIPLLSKDFQSYKNTYKHSEEEKKVESKTKKPTESKDTSSKSNETLSEMDSIFSKDDIEDCELDKTQFLLTMSQAIIDKLTEGTSKTIKNNESLFEPFTQVIKYLTYIFANQILNLCKIFGRCCPSMG